MPERDATAREEDAPLGKPTADSVSPSLLGVNEGQRIMEAYGTERDHNERPKERSYRRQHCAFAATFGQRGCREGYAQANTVRACERGQSAPKRARWVSPLVELFQRKRRKQHEEPFGVRHRPEEREREERKKSARPSCRRVTVALGHPVAGHDHHCEISSIANEDGSQIEVRAGSHSK